MDPESGEGTLIPGTHGIREEEVAESAPMVRALVVSRLEMMWRSCEPHIMPPPPEDGELPRRPDPRFVEAGIRIVDRLTALYGLLKPQQAADEPAEQGPDAVEAAVRQVEALEARLKGPSAG
jgi:hypothetical protein